MPPEKPSDIETLWKWLVRIAAVIGAIGTVAGIVWGLSRTTTTKEIDLEQLQARVVALEQRAPDAGRLSALEAQLGTISRSVNRIDRNFARLTCRLDPDKSHCDEATASIGDGQ